MRWMISGDFCAIVAWAMLIMLLNDGHSNEMADETRFLKGMRLVDGRADVWANDYEGT